MSTSFVKYLNILEKLSINPDEYLITGSAVLAVHGIRDCHDFDILCSNKLSKYLKSRFSQFEVVQFPLCESLFIEGIEFMFNLKEKKVPWSAEQQIAEADIIDGKRYQTLERLRFFKKQQSREKDIQDIKLIELYENKL